MLYRLIYDNEYLFEQVEYENTIENEEKGKIIENNEIVFEISGKTMELIKLFVDDFNNKYTDQQINGVDAIRMIVEFASNNGVETIELTDNSDVMNCYLFNKKSTYYLNRGFNIKKEQDGDSVDLIISCISNFDHYITNQFAINILLKLTSGNHYCISVNNSGISIVNELIDLQYQLNPVSDMNMNEKIKYLATNEIQKSDCKDKTKFVLYDSIYEKISRNL